MMTHDCEDIYKNVRNKFNIESLKYNTNIKQTYL